MTRIAVAGISHESSTFSLHRTGFDEFTILHGDAVMEAIRVDETLGSLADGVEWVPIVRATAIPGGPVLPEVFDSVLSDTVEGLRAALEAGPLDGVYLFLHGAVNVLGRFDAEETYVAAVRSVVGADVPISASMDTHGNFSPALAAMLDLACAHRHAPHIDIPETHARAVRNLLAVIDRGQRPFRAHVPIPSLLPGERTSTLVSPGEEVFGALLPAIEEYGVLDANLWVGFAWADEPRNMAAAYVTGWSADAVAACASAIAERFWVAQDGFVIVAEHSGTWDEALDFALTAPGAPLYISDSGDNVSAGATGDITAALRATLERRDVDGLSFLFAGLIDPVSLDAAIAVGAGGVLSRGIGAQIDSRYGIPVARDWQVERIIDGLQGEGVTGALLRSGNVSVTVQNHRAYFLTPDDAAFKRTSLRGVAWVDPTAYDVVVVKNGYLFPGQITIAGSWFMAITPGGTDLDFDRLAFEHVQRPLFPLDPVWDADLTPTALAPGAVAVPAPFRDAGIAP